MDDVNHIEVSTKAGLLRAVRACPHGSTTQIVSRRQDGRTTRITLGPGDKHTPESFDRHLASIAATIKRTPANVWR